MQPYKKRKTGKTDSTAISRTRRVNASSRVSRAFISANQIYRFVQTVDLGQLIIYGTGGADNAGAIKFQLNQLTQASSFTSLFDQYRFKKVVIDFIPLNDQSMIYASSTSGSEIAMPQMGYLTTAIDYDDAGTPTLQSDLLQYQTCKVNSITTRFSRTIYPRMAVAAYGSSVFTSFMNAGPQWIDAASTTVEHYGLKWYLNNGTSTVAAFPMYKVVCKYYLEFRTVR